MAAKNSTLTQERLKELLHYDPETGIFTWKIRTSRCIRIGSIAGCRKSNGYIVIRADDCLHLAHRLAWFYMFSKWPSHGLDHINCLASDNKISNLREATTYENAQNHKTAAPNNKSGLLGVNTHGLKWRARIYVSGRLIQIGSFQTPELAHAAYLAAKRIHHPFCTI